MHCEYAHAASGQIGDRFRALDCIRRTLTDALPSSSQLPGLSLELVSPGRWTARAASVRSVTISFVCEDMARTALLRTPVVRRIG